jgi:nucleotide-binding universal stress UspA family protein
MKTVFATDGSPAAQAAGALLQTLPLPAEAEIAIITVVPQNPSWAEIFAGHVTENMSLIEALEEEQQERTERYLAEAAEPFRDRKFSVTTASYPGHPGAEIVRVAEEAEADLVVVGSHGRTGLAAVLIGSTAEHVAKRANCPVLVARGPGTAIQRILLATDGSEHSHRAMERLRDLPLPHVAVTALHVTESFYASPGLVPALREEFERTVEEVRRAQRQNAELLAEGTRRFLEAAGYTATPTVRTGSAAEEILAAAREEASDLIVVGARGLSPAREFFLGSVSGRVLRYAPCSVLIAR